MAMTARLLDTGGTSKPTKANKTASAKSGSGKTASAKPAPPKLASRNAAAHILQPAKGPRTISHRQIKEAVEKIFRERAQARD